MPSSHSDRIMMGKEREAWVPAGSKVRGGAGF